MNRKLVIIPTYNEKENIENIITTTFSISDVHILVVDDGSPDGTAAIVKGLMANQFSDRLFIAERSGKLGLGTAYIHVFKWGLEHNYDYIFEMDADFSHNPNDLARLYEACESGADLAVGSRYCNGVNVLNWPMKRLLMSYYGSWYVRFVLGMPVMDTTAGFICYRAEVLKTVNLDKIHHVGYGFQIEMKYTAFRLGFKLKEVPIVFVDRTLGTSKMSAGIFKEAIFGVIGLKWRSMFRNWKKERAING